ncbi:UNVERIFIED_CONTAM: hypothetical protein FKN15_047068 [Acipenser sinensis]
MTHALSDLCHSPMLVLAIFVLGIGGTFQYGFQISVLNSPSPVQFFSPQYIKKFLNETWLMRYGAALEDWKLNLIWSFIISLYAVGGLIGALNAGHLAVKYGSPMLVLAIFVLGIGGTFQYGFQISVLNSPSPYIKKFLNETWLMRYGAALEDWKLNLIWSFIISLYAVGGLIGALNAGHLAVKYGRKRCLLSNNFVAIAGGVMMGLSRRAQSFEMIMVGRFLYGINAGISLNVQTMYLGESAPKRLRGLVSMTVSTFLSTGKLSGQLLGLNEILGSEDLWPVLLAFSVVPALIQLVSLPFFPETPRYLLIDKGDQVQCEKAIQRLWEKGDYRSEIHDMVLEHAAIKGEKSKSVLELILEKSLKWQLLTVIVTFTTLQLCGINAIYLYSFDVFRAAGIPTHQVRYVALGTGLCEIFTSLFCLMMPVITGNTTPQAKMDSTLEELNTSLQLFEGNFLQDKNFIVGQEISLADIVAIVELMQPLGSGLDIFEGRPKLTAWRERVKASIGKELFDEVHELILNAGDLHKKMEHSVMLPHLKTRLQKMLN